MQRIAVAGAAGRMGIRVIHAIHSEPRAVLSAALEARGHDALGKSVRELAAVPCPELPLTDNVAQVFANSDLMIDFTVPQATAANVQAALEAGKSMVIGTTGLDEAQIEDLKKASQKIPLVFAPNMSVGMNLMFKLAQDMARVLGDDFAMEIVEAHHDQKKDAPSGSALKLIEGLAKARGWDPKEVCAHGRQGQVGKRPKNQIGVSVIRGGDIVGDHTVYFIGQGERLELTHRAYSRDTFAKGAVRAALWLEDKKPGLYTMQDVLGLTDYGK